MEYTVNKLAKMSGISARTLRYYDQIGLLKPQRQSSNGYRIYGKAQVDMLQQILFYREMGVSLDEIKAILTSPSFNVLASLQTHLDTLKNKRERIDALIQNVSKTIQTMKGEIIMTDTEKFEGFKRELINENEKKYGEEIREKYGDDAINRANAKVMNMTEQQHAEVVALCEKLNSTLKAAFEKGNPASELAQKACDLHRQWLCYFYDGYSKEYHIGLGEMYVADSRFTAYYDKIAPGCAEFLRDAIKIYCK